MGMKFTDPNLITKGLQRQAQSVINEAQKIVEETIAEAVELQKHELDTATTRYGEYRMSRGRGRSAGRNDSGKMLDAIKGDVRKLTPTLIEGRWGWWNGEMYYRYQDFGTGRIPPARSLLDSYMQIRQVFAARISRLGRR